MRMNGRKRSVLPAALALAALLAGCGGEGGPEPGAEGPAAVVKSQVREIQQATASGDMDTVIRYTHPVVIEMIGGEEKMRDLLEGSLGEMLAQVEMREFDFRGEPEFLAGEEHEFVLVPVRSVFGIMGRAVTSRSFQLGVRRVGAPDWKYLESPELPFILECFPDFPEDHPLPETGRELE